MQIASLELRPDERKGNSREWTAAADCGAGAPGAGLRFAHDIARIAAGLCGADFACLILDSEPPVWCSQESVLPPAAAPGRDPFASLAARAGVVEIADAGDDPRCNDAALSIAGVAIHSYAGCALESASGDRLGILGVYGAGIAAPGAARSAALELVARQAVALIELQSRVAELQLSSAAALPHAAGTMAQALLESAPVAIYHTVGNDVIPYVNPEYRRVFGLTPEQSIYDWAKDVHPADRARMEESWSDFCRNPRAMNFEYRVQPASGEVRYYREQLVPIGRIGGFVGTISDFTDLVAARGDLRKAETLFLNTFDQAPIGIASTDRQGRFLRCNPALCALLGRSAQDLVGRIDADLTHCADREASSAALGALWRGEVDCVDLEKRYLREDGTFVWVRSTTALIRNALGEPDCAVEFLRDISNRKELAEALQAQQTLLEAVITDLPVALVACDPTGRATHYNRAALELYCVRSVGEPAAVYLADGITAVGEHEMPLARALAGETIVNLELVIAPKDGERRITLSNARRLVGAAGRILGAVATFQDITERRRSELDLERVHKQLMAASRQAGMAEVATNVLHNVGNILNSVNISASLVAERVKQSKAAGLSRVAALLREQGPRLGEFLTADPRGRRIPEYIETLSGHLEQDQRMTLEELASLRENLEHIKDTVAMQQSYAKLCGITEVVEVADLLEDSLRLNAGALTRHGVTLQREFAAVPPITVDKHKVLQILVNLIRNAKYACDESGRSDKLIILRTEPLADGVRISVIDNGVGILPENMGRLFSHGFTTRKSGHGFGLHSGAVAAQDLGGTLRAASDGPGTGAAFILELPRVPREAGRA